MPISLGLTLSNKRARWWPVALMALAIPLGIWLASMSLVSISEKEAHAEEGVDESNEIPSDVSIEGRVLGIDGKPASAIRVIALPKAWSTQSGLPPETTTDRKGEFRFKNLPDGPCDIDVTPVPLTNQPNMRIEGVVLKEGEPVHVELSLEQKYEFAGHVIDADGEPCTTLASRTGRRSRSLPLASTE
ncbi:MAG: carboxypeptidase-like regulatory domain-containing protein [Planctomycetota bacterium]